MVLYGLPPSTLVFAELILYFKYADQLFLHDSLYTPLMEISWLSSAAA